MDIKGFSNTAVPEEYARWRQLVIDGQIPVCKMISHEMNRIDARIADPKIFYSKEAVDGFINFVEAELTKTDGSALEFLPSFKLWAEQLFGWWYLTTEFVHKVDENGKGYFEEITVLKRLIKKLFLIVARGAAKTMFLAFVQAYFLIVDGETTHQITTAPTMKQAEEVMSPIRTAIARARGPVIQFMTGSFRGMKKVSHHKVMLVATKKGIEAPVKGSLLEIRPMAIHKLQGLRSKVNTVDEWLSGDSREGVIGALEQGASKLPDYVIVAASSEGVVRNAAGDEIKSELIDILTGVYDDQHTCIFYYRLDDITEIANPAMWIKANPNIGLTVSYSVYHRDVLRAEKVPSARNDIVAKRFGIPMEGYSYFFSYEETIAHYPVHHYRGLPCAMGADMSQGDDFCSFTFLFPFRDFRFGVKSINFITERTFKLLSPLMTRKYQEFIDEGSLKVMPGAVLDMEQVFYALIDEIEKREYEVLAVGYDPYNADVFISLWKSTYGEFGVEVIRQGVITESVPLGEIKNLSEDRLLRFDEKIFSYAMGNAMVQEDNNGNLKLFKRRYENKIDPVAALIDAYIALIRNRDSFE